MEGNAKQIPFVQISARDIEQLQTLKEQRAKLLIALKITTARLKNVDWLGSKGVINEALEIINEIENKTT